MKRSLLGVLLMSAISIAAQTEQGRYARISTLRPHDGDTVDFEAGYIRHLEWHRQAKDSWRWYGWTIWAGDRQRSFVYATFNRTTAELNAPVSPVDDERDNIINVTPHAQFTGSALYEFLPELSRGSGEPTPSARVEMLTVELTPGNAKSFEAALRGEPQGETLWYRMIAGGSAPRYVRLRPRASLGALLDERAELPEAAARLVAKETIEILSFRPAMSYGLAP